MALPPKVKLHTVFRDKVDTNNIVVEDRKGVVFSPNGQTKYFEHLEGEVIPLRKETDCCCCCGCRCNCGINVAGKIIDLADPTCENFRSWCFVKAALVDSRQATLVETYSTPKLCGEFTAIGGINLLVTKESLERTYVVSFSKADVNNNSVGGDISVHTWQTDSVFSIYYQRVTIAVDQVCTIPDAAWQYNPDTNVPEIIDSSYDPACSECRLTIQNILSGAGVKPCCTSVASTLSCGFSIVGGKGAITLLGNIVGLWQYKTYPEVPCVEFAFNFPEVICRSGEEEYVELDSHSWHTDDFGYMPCLLPVSAGLGCLPTQTRNRRQKHRFTPLLAQTTCKDYETENTRLDELENYDSKELNSNPYIDPEFTITFEVNNDRAFNPNTDQSQLIDVPVGRSVHTDTTEVTHLVGYFYTPVPPACNRCLLELQIGNDTVEIMEPGCQVNAEFCFYNYNMIHEYESTWRIISDPKFACDETWDGVTPPIQPTVGDGVYREALIEFKGRYFVNSVTQAYVYTDPVNPKIWYLRLEQRDYSFHLRYGRGKFITEFGAGCYTAECDGSVSALYYSQWWQPAEGCFFASDVLNRSCNNHVWTLSRLTIEGWGWQIFDGACGSGTCIGPRFIPPPEGYGFGCGAKADPFSESWDDELVKPCGSAARIGSDACADNTIQTRIKVYKLVNPEGTEIKNVCKELKKANPDLQWEEFFVYGITQDTGIRDCAVMRHSFDGTVRFSPSDNISYGATGSGVDGKLVGIGSVYNEVYEVFSRTATPISPVIPFYGLSGSPKIVCPPPTVV